MSAIAALAVALGEALQARGWRAATAESCTGGLVAGAITDVAGSSGWFDRGFVTYSNEAKTDLLGVAPALIAEHGAVSEQVARAMAEGALARSDADVAVAITGIAGPGGATPSKPVGMVCIAFAQRGLAAHADTHHYAGTRAEVRAAAVHDARKRAIDACDGDRRRVSAPSPPATATVAASARHRRLRRRPSSPPAGRETSADRCISTAMRAPEPCRFAGWRPS